MWSWLRRLLTPKPKTMRKLPVSGLPSDSERRVLDDFCRQFEITFQRPDLLKLALTHRSYLSVTGQSARESNERLEFLGDSVLGLVTSEFLYREHPSEHEGQLTKTKSLLVSKAILSRRALAMGLGKYVLMSRSESDSGGRQRLSILADAFESVIGAIYLDQGFEASRDFIMRWLLRDSREIVADKRHTNYKSHLQEFVQSTYRTHPVYRIRSEMGPDHSKQFNVEVLVGRRVLGTGRGRNKKDAEQAAARNALEQSEGRPRGDDDVRRPSRPGAVSEPRRPSRPGAVSEPERPSRPAEAPRPAHEPEAPARSAAASDERESRRRGRRGGRGRRGRPDDAPPKDPAPNAPREEAASPPPGVATAGMMHRGRGSPSTLAAPTAGDAVAPPRGLDDDAEEIGRPEGMFEERRVDPYALEREGQAGMQPDARPSPPVSDRFVGGRTVERLGRREWIDVPSADPVLPESEDEPESGPSREPSLEREPSEPDEEAPGPPSEGEGPVYGRRRSRR